MGKIKITETGIKDLVVIEPEVFEDSRGYFFESYNKQDFCEAGLFYNFVQDNMSKSLKGVLRGLHFQKHHPQAKLVMVTEGEVFDVAVDLRKNSDTYGKWYGLILSENNKKQLLVPRGFAHGFLVLSEMATFYYKCDDFYHPDDEGGLFWNDPDIGIVWPKLDNIIIKDRDSKYPTLNDLK